MERIFSNWNLMRIIRLIIGIYAGYQSIVMHEWILGLAAVYVAGMAILNIGCCGVNGCQIPNKNNGKAAILFKQWKN